MPAITTINIRANQIYPEATLDTKNFVIAVEPIAVNAANAAALLGYKYGKFFQILPELKACGLRVCDERYEVQSLREAFRKLTDIRSGDVRRSKKAV